jgi:predicted AlkP superfamily phosphohydrolase/phosphomutase
LGTRVFRPEQIYARVNGVAPDLIVHFGDLAWRAVGGVGYPGVHVRENDTGPDDCNHAQHGAFVLAGAGVPAIGELRGAHLLDVAPTLLALGRYDIPAEMQGRALLEPSDSTIPSAATEAPHQRDEIIRERLKGLGYLG